MNEYKPVYGMSLLWMWIGMTLVVLPFALVGDVVAALTGHTSLGQILGAFLQIKKAEALASAFA